jgi:tripartite-type tricarboxylate transporter receptor subunit TctC
MPAISTLVPSMPSLLRHLTACAGLIAALAAAADAAAQSWPARQVRIVLPFGAGGSTDAIARTLGQKLSESFAQPVVIDNRPGAAGAIATDHVAKAAPDGYTLLMATTSTHSVLPMLGARLPYDPQKDFAPVALVARAPNVLIASPTLPAASVRELVALARARPGGYTFASSGTGTITHLIGEAFNAAAGIKAVHAPYKTGVQAVPDVVSGQVAWLFDSIVWSLPQIRAGKLKGLAITSRERSPLAPDMPTVAEAGLPGFEGVTWFGLVAPAAVPREVLARLNAEVNRLLQTQDMRDKLAAQGAEAAGGSAEEFGKLVREDAARWGRVIRDAGVKLE